MASVVVANESCRAEKYRKGANRLAERRLLFCFVNEKNVYGALACGDRAGVEKLKPERMKNICGDCVVSFVA